MLDYATPAQVAAWIGDAVPVNVATLIRYASLLVRRATMCAVYDVDETTGAPTDVDVAQAMADATCTQVATWAGLTIDPVVGAASTGRIVAAKSIGSASVQYSVYASQAEAKARAATTLCDAAVMILADANLTAPRPVTTR